MSTGPGPEASFDANAYRDQSWEEWQRVAAAWIRHRRMISEWTAPLSEWLLDALALQPGQRVLELAAGTGETGLMAAEMVAPGGSVIISDHSEAMLVGARVRAQEMGLPNVETRVVNAESIDLPVASMDAVVCRWGYMLLADPAAALAETRRVLVPGGAVALAVWAAAAENPWASVTAREMVARGLAPAPEPGAPGPFALADPALVEELLEQTGFSEVTLASVELQRRHPSFEDFWQSQLELSPGLSRAMRDAAPADAAALREAVAAGLQSYSGADGSLAIPGRTLVAAARA